MATSTLGSGTLVLAGTTSGTTTVTATAVAGTTTLTLPAATDTLVGKATTDTLTNKTLTGAAMNGTLGATTPSTASVTTLTTSSTITHNGGTANGVAYLDGSKVLTTGSALVFNGTSLGVGVTPSVQYSGIKSFQIGSTTNLFDNGASTKLYHNAYTAVFGDDTYLTTGYAQAYLMPSNGQHIWYTSASGTAGNTITFTQAMTLDASGKLFLGTTTTPTGTGSGIFNVEPGNQNGIAIGVVTTGNAGLDININNTGSYFAFFRYNSANVGAITYNGTLTVYGTTSDYRLKTIGGAVTGQGARIDALQPIEYTWNSNGSSSRGFLAHKFQEVYADSVSGTKDAVDADGKPVYQAMQAGSSEVIADLVAEIQSIRKRLAALESA